MNLTPSHSLRTRLLWMLVAAVAVTTIVQIYVAYHTALTETDHIFDYQMQQMARSLRPGLPEGGVALGPDSEDNFDFVVQVSTADGQQIFRSSAHTELPLNAALGFSTVRVRDTTYRLFCLVAGHQRIAVAQDLALRSDLAGELALRTVSPMLGMVPLLLLLVWWVVGASLAPVTRVRQQLAERQGDDLSQVSQTGLPDEVRPLVQELNLLLARVRRAFDAQKNFVADAAHELRSPLAALKLQVEVLRRAPTESVREVALQRLVAGIERATRLVEQLLLLARHQEGSAMRAPALRVDLGAVARLALADVATAARQRDITLHSEVLAMAPVLGHEEGLRILVRNLLDNAIKYTPAGGQVRIAVQPQGSRALLRVEDSGPGIAPEDRVRVFDRFHRLPAAQGSGSGLGLAIVKTVADLHGAALSLEVGAELGGLCVLIELPLVA